MVPAADLEIGGAAYYRDEYVKANGRWLIDHTGYERVFEERRVHSTLALVSFTLEVLGPRVQGRGFGL